VVGSDFTAAGSRFSPLLSTYFGFQFSYFGCRWRVSLRFIYFGFPFRISVLRRPVTDLDSSRLVLGCRFQFFVSARVCALSSFPHCLFLKSEQYLRRFLFSFVRVLISFLLEVCCSLVFHTHTTCFCSAFDSFRASRVSDWFSAREPKKRRLRLVAARDF
jgi:hypothetical protein